MSNTMSGDAAAIDIEGSGFVEGFEDEKGDFEPAPREKRKRRPTHPGAILRDLYLPRTGGNLTELAATIGVSRRTVSMIVNESRPVTVDMAHRLARAFGTSSRLWLNLQRDVDDFEALHEKREEYERIPRLIAA
jgi:addiction module HigA family antidote